MHERKKRERYENTDVDEEKKKRWETVVCTLSLWFPVESVLSKNLSHLDACKQYDVSSNCIPWQTSMFVWTDFILCWQPNMTSVLRSCDEFILICESYFLALASAASEQPWLISSSKQPSDTYLPLLNTHTHVWYCPLPRWWSEAWTCLARLFLWCLVWSRLVPEEKVGTFIGIKSYQDSNCL